MTDQLQMRQTELQLQRTLNQVRVDVKTAVIGLQQARARYETAVDTRALAEQSLVAEQSRFKYGVATVAQVIQAQKDLATGQDSEVQAMANYTHARDRVRYGDGAHAGREPHLDGGGAWRGRYSGNRSSRPTLPAPRAQAVGK